ncbi:MAG: winged helix-turn-helix domain-containing protein [Acidobacteriota bacterium]|nr:winged helix-turn-helix domain-containing protein [Acidobacteriota bacterium]
MLDKHVYEFSGFRLDTAERVLESAGRPISVAPKALDVLIVLVENRGRIVEKESLMREVWPGIFVEENSLAFNVSVLRKIFAESSASPRYIETVPKRGYRFIAELAEVPELGVASRLSTTGAPSASLAAKAIAPEPRSGRFARPLLFVSALVLLAGIGILISRFHRTPKLTGKERIVLADFVNKTGDPVFDGTLHQGLAIELEQSPFLSVISEERVRRTLRLMRQPGETRLTPALVREVCQRIGSAVVLEGSIVSVGKQYVLGLRAMDCAAGDILDNQQVQVRSKEDVLSGLTQIADRFRSRAGESSTMLTRHDVPLAEATTASLEALRAYSAAWEIHASRGATDALPLFKRATELDPEFAMAHASLGRIYADLDQSDLSAKSIGRAWQLRDRTSDREKFFITTNYQILVTGNVEEARKTGEAWARTYPLDAAPHMMLSGYVNKVPGRYEDAAAEAWKAIELAPDFGIGYYNAAVNNAYLERFEQADRALQRAAARGLEIDEFLMLAYDIAFLRNDPAAMEHVSARARRRPGPQSWISNKEASALAYSGHLQQARSTSLRAVVEAQQGEQRERAGLWESGAAVREALFGNASRSRESAVAALELSTDREVEYGAAFALAVTGDSLRSQQIAGDLERRFPDDTAIRFSYLPVLRARVALNRREPAKAIEALQMAVPNELGAPPSMADALFGALYPIYLRGEADLALKRGTQAAVEFKKILDHRGIVISDPIGALARLQLGRAFVLAGERNKAKDAYQDFLTLWKDADPGIPVFRQARAEYANLQ